MVLQTSVRNRRKQSNDHVLPLMVDAKDHGHSAQRKDSCPFTNLKSYSLLSKYP